MSAVTAPRPATPPHSRPLLLADEPFLLAHDVTGRPPSQSRAICLGLAGALLGQLLAVGRVTIRDGQVLAVRPADALAGKVFDDLAVGRPRHSVRTWPAFGGRHATPPVAQRLEWANLVTHTAGERCYVSVVHLIQVRGRV